MDKDTAVNHVVVASKFKNRHHIQHVNTDASKHFAIKIHHYRSQTHRIHHTIEF